MENRGAAGLIASEDGLPEISGALLEWYGRCARSLPWRDHPEPYHVWVSEIMLQQTRVEAVVPYYLRFTGALPDVSALASAQEDLLLKLWEGLGYYGRVRNMQKAAQIVVRQYGGRFPSSYDGLLGLPGIGEYTAGAIASIAFHLPAPAVDGNVLRVLSRVLACGEDVSQTKIRREFQKIECRLQPPGRAGDFNQAVMDLGALVCLPNGAPRCGECPLNRICRGRLMGREAELPVLPEKKQRAVRLRTVFVILAGKRVLLHRRPADGLLARLWELPGREGWLSPEEAAGYVEELRNSGGEAADGTDSPDMHRLADARHVFSHLEWKMRGYRFRVPLFSPPQGCVWAGAEELEGRYALPRAFGAYAGELAAQLKDPAEVGQSEI